MVDVSNIYRAMHVCVLILRSLLAVFIISDPIVNSISNPILSPIAIPIQHPIVHPIVNPILNPIMKTIVNPTVHSVIRGLGRAGLVLACGEPGWWVGGGRQGPGWTRFVFRLFCLSLGGIAVVGGG